MTAPKDTAQDELQGIASANGWKATGTPEGAIEFRKRGRGYLWVDFTATGNVSAYRGARRADGTDPYPVQTTSKREAVAAILSGVTR